MLFMLVITGPNPGVIAWLEDLDSEITDTTRMLLRLVNLMLSMNPNARPTADHVTSNLCYVARDADSRCIVDKFELLLGEPASNKLGIERQRFRSWIWAFRPYGDGEDPPSCKIYSQLDSNSILKTLVQVYNELKSITSRYDDTLSPTFQDLRYLNDRIMVFLPWESQEGAKTDFEFEMIQTSDINLVAC